MFVLWKIFLVNLVYCCIVVSSVFRVEVEKVFILYEFLLWKYGLFYLRVLLEEWYVFFESFNFINFLCIRK